MINDKVSRCATIICENISFDDKIKEEQQIVVCIEKMFPACSMLITYTVSFL